MFIDQVHIYVKAGDGGAGAKAFRREAYVPKGGPSGGDGAPGGNVVLVGDPGISSLIDYRFKHHFKADRGTHGKGSRMHGQRGEDRRLRVPLGTIVSDSDTGEELGDITFAGQELIVAEGGHGGRGNPHFVTSVRRAPAFAELGEPGQERNISLELKLLADAALVGLPSVGKSSIISRLSASRPKIADYPFTTLVPNLGVVYTSDHSFVLADIPGLIEGASDGKGLGHDFLRHIERSALVLHVVDLSGGFENRDAVEDFLTIENELKAYGRELDERPVIVVGNKIDAEGAEERDASMQAFCQERELEYFAISAVTGQGLDSMARFVAQRVHELRLAAAEELARAQEEAEFEAVYRLKSQKAADREFSVQNLGGGVFQVQGRKLERMVIQTEMSNEEAVIYLQRRLKRAGLERELLRAGARRGDEVRILETAFEFDPEEMIEDEDES